MIQRSKDKPTRDLLTLFSKLHNATNPIFTLKSGVRYVLYLSNITTKKPLLVKKTCKKNYRKTFHHFTAKLLIYIVKTPFFAVRVNGFIIYINDHCRALTNKRFLRAI